MFEYISGMFTGLFFTMCIVIWYISYNSAEDQCKKEHMVEKCEEHIMPVTKSKGGKS